MDHPYDCFFYTSDRRSIRPETFLSSFRGYLVTDAYIAYERIGDLMPDIIKASWNALIEAYHYALMKHVEFTAEADSDPMPRASAGYSGET